MGEPASGALAGVLGDVPGVIDGAAAADLAPLSGDELTDLLCAVQAVRARVDALACRVAAAVGARQVPRAEGLLGAGSLAGRHGDVDTAGVGSDARLGRFLRRFPVLGDGLASGRLTRRHVEVLRGAVNTRSEAAMAHQQDWFVTRATGLGWKDFVSVVRCRANAVDPDGTPLHPAIAVAVLASATLRRLVMGTGSEILDLGRRVRCFLQHLREVLLVAGRGQCAVLGCDAPATWLRADHLVPWARGGPTEVANGRTCCDPHDKAAKRDGHPP